MVGLRASSGQGLVSWIQWKLRLIWADQPGSRAALIFFAESEQSSCHFGKLNLVWGIVFLNFGFGVIF